MANMSMEATQLNELQKSNTIQTDILRVQKETLDAVRILDKRLRNLEAKQNKTTIHEPETAGQRLITTPELLHMILLELPWKDLLFAQSVSTLFRDTIQNSLQIQQKLYLIHDPYATAYGKINPLFRQKSIYQRLPIYFDTGAQRVTSTSGGQFRRVTCTNIYVITYPPYDGKPYLRMELSVVPATVEATNADERWQALREGSWRNMRLSHLLSHLALDVFVYDSTRHYRLYYGEMTGLGSIDDFLNRLAATPLWPEP